jgi:hypothetical protein
LTIIQAPQKDNATKATDTKSWMMCIFLLAKDVFGDRFIRKKETSKRAKSEKRCYNYFTDKQVVEVAIGLMNWNLRNLDYITPEIVQTYDLERRKENDQRNEDIAKSSDNGSRAH